MDPAVARHIAPIDRCERLTRTCNNRARKIMASQPVAVRREDLASLSVQSYISGYHAYMDRWNPRIGEVLLHEREPNNSEGRFAVAIKRTGSVVGHVPFNLAPLVSAFLRREVSKGLVEVTGEKINRGGGYGLEIPCTYHFYRAKSLIDELNELVEALRNEGCI